MNEALAQTIKKFLHYSFSDINYKYDDLTDTEKSLATREEFEALVAWTKGE